MVFKAAIWLSVKSKWEVNKNMASLVDRFTHAWNAFMNKDPTRAYREPAVYDNDIRYFPKVGGEKSITVSVYERISIDAAACDIRHVTLDDNGRFSDVVDSHLNRCLESNANIDQTSNAFVKEAIYTMLDTGKIAIVPTKTPDGQDPRVVDNFDVLEMRVGHIEEMYPHYVKMWVYNEDTGKRESLVLPKKMVAIAQNPFYETMNTPNSIAQRINRKFSLLDYVDEQTGSPKLDMIIKLPYTIRTESLRERANERKKDLEMQLSSSKYGIAYIDQTESVTQLNRSLENQLLPQIKELKYMFFSQLGITDEIMNGTADQSTLNNYYQRTIVPILGALVDAMRWKFLSEQVRYEGVETETVDPETGDTYVITQKQSLMFFNDPFKLIPTNQLAEIADKFTRNEIMTSNEIRQAIGIKPSRDPRADELRNANISESKDEVHYDLDGNQIQ